MRRTWPSSTTSASPRRTSAARPGRFKAATTRTLAREEAIRLLGYLPAPRAERAAVYARLREALPEASRTFWDGQGGAIAKGVIWAGRYERYVGLLVRALSPLLGRRFAGLFRCTSLDEQARYFDERLDVRRLRALFGLAFHPKIFARRGMDPRSLQHRHSAQPLAEQYFGHLRQACTATPVSDNHLLQVHLLSRVLSADAVPAWLSAEGFATVAERLDSLRLVRADLAEHLDACAPGSFDKAHLSNLPDWLDQPGFERVVGLVAERAAPGGRAVWRHIHVDRPVPAELAERVALDRSLGAELRAVDRFPFYGIVPAAIHAGTP